MLTRCVRPSSLLFALLLIAGTLCPAQSTATHPIDIDSTNTAQYGFLAPLVKNVEVVSLAESIHMTHEFPPARIGMVRWLNQNAGFGELAMEGSPEDVWVSQDVFLRNPTDLADATSGVFDIWSTPEMQQLFAYEASTWQTSHPLYITSYDIQPGTGRGSVGSRVFELLAERLKQYAPPPSGFDEKKWVAELTPLTNACSAYKASDQVGVYEGIEQLREWIDVAEPQVEKAFPKLPQHAAALLSIPQNLRESIALCSWVEGMRYGADIYKPTRDKHAAEFALDVKDRAPRGKLILWAHVSHLYYDADRVHDTSVGELLHRKLGSRLYTIGAFAGGGGAIMLFSDWDGVIGYGRVWGVSGALRSFFNKRCPNVCFANLKELGPGSPFASPQTIWYEGERTTMTLASDFDGIIWVRTVHPPQLPLSVLITQWCTTSYWKRYWLLPVVTLLALALAVVLLVIWRRKRGRKARSA